MIKNTGSQFGKQKVGRQLAPKMTSADEQYNYSIPSEQVYSSSNLNKFKN